MWLVIIDVFIVDFPLTLLTSRDSPLFLIVAHLSIVFSLVSFLDFETAGFLSGDLNSAFHNCHTRDRLEKT